MKLKFKQLPIVLIVVLAIAAFLRLYNLPGNMMFLGDQGRDAIIVKRIFKNLDPVFIGPVTSVGNMYLGPLYYYFMIPSLALTYPSPVGPAYAIAFLGILTVFLIYHLGKELIGKQAALIASIFYGLSATVIGLARFSWNPNPAPFISLVMLWATYKALKNIKYWLLVSICFAVLLQLHYVTLLAAAGAGLIWILQLGRCIKSVRAKNFQPLRNLLIISLTSLAILISSLAPLVLFDSKHNWLNAQAFKQMLTGKENFAQNQATSIDQKIVTVLKETHGRSMHALFEINIGKNRNLNSLLLLIFLIILSYLLFKNINKNNKKDKYYAGRLVLTSYFLTSILGLAFYQHTVFDHYIAYLFPVSFLLFGVILNYLYQKNILGKLLVIIFFSYFLFFNIKKYPEFIKNSNNNIKKLKKISQTILDRVNLGEKYNIVLLSETGDLYGQSYRYFLEVSDKPALDPEHSGEAEKLFIINEDKKIQASDLASSPIHEISIFPNKNPQEIYNIKDGPEIIVLEK